MLVQGHGRDTGDTLRKVYIEKLGVTSTPTALSFATSDATSYLSDSNTEN